MVLIVQLYYSGDLQFAMCYMRVHITRRLNLKIFIRVFFFLLILSLSWHSSLLSVVPESVRIRVFFFILFFVVRRYYLVTMTQYHGNSNPLLLFVIRISTQKLACTSMIFSKTHVRPTTTTVREPRSAVSIQYRVEYLGDGDRTRTSLKLPIRNAS